MKIIPVILLLAVSSVVAHAESESVLPFTKFSVESEGFSNSGPITVNGQTDRTGKIVALTVIAFDKTITIPKDIIDQIHIDSLNGLILSYAPGYGDRILYISMQQAFTVGVRQDIVLEVKESGTTEIKTVEKFRHTP